MQAEAAQHESVLASGIGEGDVFEDDLAARRRVRRVPAGWRYLGRPFKQLEDARCAALCRGELREAAAKLGNREAELELVGLKGHEHAERELARAHEQ